LAAFVDYQLKQIKRATHIMPTQSPKRSPGGTKTYRASPGRPVVIGTGSKSPLRIPASPSRGIKVTQRPKK